MAVGSVAEGARRYDVRLGQVAPRTLAMARGARRKFLQRARLDALEQFGNLVILALLSGWSAGGNVDSKRAWHH
jgi:hypothetical protein